MDVTEVEKILQSKAVTVPGGRDRDRRPIILVNIPQDVPSVEKSLLAKALKYALSTFSGDTRNAGVTVLIDAQRCSWRHARVSFRHIMEVLSDECATMLVVRPEAFWDKRMDNCTKLSKQGEPIYLPLSRLNKYIEPDQLPEDLGGHCPYDHFKWTQCRLRVENFMRMNSDIQSELERVCKLLNGAKEGYNNAARTMTQTSVTYNNACHSANMLINEGHNLLDDFAKYRVVEISSQDNLDTEDMVEKQLTLAQSRLSALQQAWTNLQKSITDAKEVTRLENGVRSVTDWILETGEALLAAHNQVGFDISSADQLRREHEALELHCRETYGHYAELLHQIDLSIQNGLKLPDDLRAQRDFMDFICRSFATRLERRRNILISSSRFFRLVSEYFQLTSEVYETLIMAPELEKLDKAHAYLLQLQESQANIDELEAALVREGEKLSDFLSMPVKDALGRELGFDYEADIINITEILDMTKARSELFRDSMDLQRVTLQQACHVFEYEKDAEQAIKWLKDLFTVMLKSHCFVGCSVLEIQRQKEDHQAFQDTAKGTFEYGCQLLRAAMSLRQYSKIGEGNNNELCFKLSEAWEKLQNVSHHYMTRLRVTAVLHRTLNQHCKELKELTVAAHLVKNDNLRKLLQSRERLLIEVARMLRLARLLKSRLKEPLCKEQTEVTMDGNKSAVEAISEKVAEVTALAEQLDAVLCGSPDGDVGSFSDILESSPTQEDWYRSLEKRVSPGKEDSSQEEFGTASECTCTPPSRSSSFHTASEGEASWWQPDEPEKPQMISGVLTQEVTETRQLKLSPQGLSVTTDTVFTETRREFEGDHDDLSSQRSLGSPVREQYHQEHREFQWSPSQPERDKTDHVRYRATPDPHIFDWPSAMPREITITPSKEQQRERRDYTWSPNLKEVRLEFSGSPVKDQKCEEKKGFLEVPSREELLADENGPFWTPIHRLDQIKVETQLSGLRVRPWSPPKDMPKEVASEPRRTLSPTQRARREHAVSPSSDPGAKQECFKVSATQEGSLKVLTIKRESPPLAKLTIEHEIGPRPISNKESSSSEDSTLERIRQVRPRPDPQDVSYYCHGITKHALAGVF